METKAISAFNLVEVKVEAELGNTFKYKTLLLHSGPTNIQLD